MARGVNKVILVGNVGKQPELRHLGNGDAVVNFSMATTESWKDKQSGEKVEKTEWHRLTAFQGLAEVVGKWVQKGSQIYVEGKLQTRKWQNKDGVDMYTTEIKVSDFQMLGAKPEGQQSAPAQQAATPKPPAVSAEPDFDDDIPF